MGKIVVKELMNLSTFYYFAAKRAGMDLKTFWEGIRLSAGNSFSFETAAPDIFRSGYHPWFTMALQCKDLQLGYDMSRKYKVIWSHYHLLPSANINLFSSSVKKFLWSVLKLN